MGIGEFSPDEPMRPGFQFREEEDKRIYEALHLIGVGPQAFFKDACALMADPSDYACRAQTVAHLLREIESALLDVLVNVSAERFHAPTVSQEKQEKVAKVLKALDATGAEAAARMWIAANREGRKERIAATLEWLGIGPEEAVARAWLALTYERMRFDRWAHRDGLQRPRTPDSDFGQMWRNFRQVLDIVLSEFNDRFLRVFTKLDELLAKPTLRRADARFLANNVPNNLITYRYFFSKCDNPRWLPLLRARHFFDGPPEPVLDPETQTLGYTEWPQAAYLARMASQAPEEVLEIILPLRPTDERICSQLLAAVLAMPPEITVKAVPAVLEWMDTPGASFLLPHRVGDLTVQLAKHGKEDEAFALAEKLLALQFPETDVSESDGMRQRQGDAYRYRQEIKAFMPVLISASPRRSFDLLVAIVERILPSKAAEAASKKREDWSARWRPAIEDHEQNWRQDSFDTLISALRDAAVQAVALDTSQLKPIVVNLEAREWHLFRRLALFLLSKFPDVDRNLVAVKLTDRALFDDYQLGHEYALLGKAALHLLTETEQAVILGWIQTGPDKERTASHRGYLEHSTKKVASDKDIEDYKKRWRLTKFAKFEGNLPKVWQAMYDKTVKELQWEPDTLDSFLHRRARAVVQEPPKSASELAAMTADELATFLAEWEPPNEPRKFGVEPPDRETLGRELGKAVSENPTHFVSACEVVREKATIYVPSLLRGFCDVARRGEDTLDWGKILKLCAWVVEQKPEMTATGDRFGDPFPKWEWAKSTIADLMRHGLRKSGSCTPYELRDEVWRVVECLGDDPDPTPEYEKEYGGGNMSPFTMSINTTRGMALHAVVRYALWLRRNQKERKEDFPKSFDDMPAAREVLEHHLDPQKDPALSIRAVYGQWFPWLWFLDAKWATDHVAAIFPSDETERDRWQAAWHAYIAYCQPYNDVLKPLRGEYARAIERMDQDPTVTKEMNDPDVCLGEHLLLYYCRDLIELDGLLNRFFQVAPPETAKRAMANLGYRLAKSEEKLPDDLALRVRDLIKWRLDAIENKEPGADPAELGEYGWFFTGGMFDSEWSLRMLARTIRLANAEIESGHSISKELAKRFPEHPLLVMECLQLIVQSAQYGWSLLNEEDEMRAILSGAREHTDGEVRKAAEIVINQLGVRGLYEYRDLLPESPAH